MARSLFEANVPAEVQVEDSYRREVLSGRILGANDQSVAVRVVDATGRPVGLMQGTRVTLSVQRLASHYTFETVVLGTRMQPEAMLLLQRPGDESSATRRASMRIDTLISGARLVVGVRGQAEFLNATVLDLSVGGALVRTDQPVSNGARAMLAFPLPSQGNPVSADGTALRCTERPGSKSERASYRTAMRFTRIDPADQDRIARFILTREKEMRLRGAV
jgi:c-di-GMP-binding flagellar brake protein YcgR